jgi:adenylyltransferase/sulfurtransferase
MNAIQINNRYERQIALHEFGEAGQKKLAQARILVIGAGGLGCPALQYLAAAGIGTIGIVDFDVVALSNLQRQTLYTVADIGKSKVIVAAKRLEALNPEIKIRTFNLQMTQNNAIEILSEFDVIIDGSDNFTTRYLVNDACVLLNKPLVYGAVLRFEGQIGVFNLFDAETNIKTNYRDLFPNSSKLSEAISCNDVGVLGVIPGIIGTMQATEAIKICAGIGKVLSNKIVTYNALQNTFYDFEIVPNPASQAVIPKNEFEFLNFNYEFFCNTSPFENEISTSVFETFLVSRNCVIIDVREKDELPRIAEFETILIPLNQLKNSLQKIPLEKTVIFICKSGIRSQNAAILLKEKQPQCEIFSLKGGLDSWKKYSNKQ